MKKYIILMISLFLLFFFLFNNVGQASTKVETQKKDDGWQLLLNGQPFELKGVGAGRNYGYYDEDYLLMAKEMGANAVRTWNYTPNEINKNYLDNAQALDLYVASWMWLNPAKKDWVYISYKEGSPYREICKERVRRWVEDLKDHPALLMWGVGNEVIYFSDSEEEKVAFAQFLNELCQLIHELDPNHPVIYASMQEVALPYLAQHTPDLDIVGINTYSNVICAQNRWKMSNFDIPYILTEFGPVNKWGVGIDGNGLPLDPPDWHKAKQYKRFSDDLQKYKKSCLGGFVFYIGEIDQWTASWWSLNWRDLKRASYWTMYEAYTGKKPSNLPPKIKEVSISKCSNLAPFEEIDVKISAEDPEGDPLTIGYELRILKEGIILTLPDEYNEEIMTPTETGFTLSMPSYKCKCILYILVKDDQGNVAVANRSLVINK
jgi:hypothetical protein